MANLSLRRHLTQIGEPKSSADMALVRDFNVLPPSGRLRDIMKAMRSPKPEQWTKANQGKFSEDWTADCQGVTHDSSYWYVSSNNVGIGAFNQAVYRLSLANDVVDRVRLPATSTGSLHLGPIDYHNGRIYCAMDNPVKIVVIDTPPFKEWWVAELRGESGGEPPQTRCSCCAVNPWNGLLYSAQITKSIAGDTLFAYRLDSAGKRFLHVPSADIVLPEKLLFVQGAVFSKNGHVLLASDETSDIRCYSVLNGHYLGRAHIPRDNSWNVEEEVEGLTIWEGISYDGVATHVHIILLDNDEPDRDDVFFKHYRVPLSEDL